MLPPYGVMNNQFADHLQRNAGPPPDWKGPDWPTFKQGVVGTIAEKLWPVFDTASKTWKGNAAGCMEKLTEADLDLLSVIRNPKDPNRPLETKPSTALASFDLPAHHKFFDSEDISDIFAQYAFYDRTRPFTDPLSFQGAFIHGVDTKVDSASLQFKLQFQRPRPYQTAFIFGKTFNWEVATSSMTPSLPSGHSLEGLMGCGALYERTLQEGPALGPQAVEVLQQYAADIGDRRVMAGVHYPSDNIASWFIALEMAPYVFSDERVEEFLRAAIQRSFVHRLLVTSQNPVYREPLSLLE